MLQTPLVGSDTGPATCSMGLATVSELNLMLAPLNVGSLSGRLYDLTPRKTSCARERSGMFSKKDLRKGALCENMDFCKRCQQTQQVARPEPVQHRK